MSFNFNSIEHAIAAVAADVVKAAKAVAAFLPKIQAAEGTVEAVTAVVYPQAVPIERASFAALGLIAKAVAAAEPAAAANGLNVQLDAQFVADVRELLPTLKQELAKIGVKL